MSLIYDSTPGEDEGRITFIIITIYHRFKFIFLLKAGQVDKFLVLRIFSTNCRGRFQGIVGAGWSIAFHMVAAMR